MELITVRDNRHGSQQIIMKLEGVKQLAVRNDCNIDVPLFVISESMEPLIKRNSTILLSIGNVNIKIGDIVVFRNIDRNYCCHRVIAKQKNYYITKGDNNKFSDEVKVTSKLILGKVKIIGYKKHIINIIYKLFSVLYLIMSPIILLRTRKIYVYK